MRISEVRELGENALQEKLSELKAELAREKALIASGTRPEKPGKTRKTRKAIARLLTVMREREMVGKKEKTRGKK